MSHENTSFKCINASYILHEIAHLLHLERGLFFSVKKLLVSPGKSIIEFIDIDRTKIIKPVVFVIITSLIHNIADKFAHFNAHASEKVINNNTASIIDNWFTNNLGYYNICLGVFVALLLKLLYFKNKYNLFEILVLMCYVIGMDMLWSALIGVLSVAFHFPFMKPNTYVIFIYNMYAISSFFGPKKWYNYIKAIVAFIAGLIILFFFPHILGLLVDMFINLKKF
jgi:Protein of unknown function (DUF3667)